MDISANAEKIISQADQWTFAGDCSLLQWMEEIGKNLEQRATETNKHFDQLATNLKQTGTALDNVTNSLAALQYTQFVESRCHDDDETIANVTEVPLNVADQNDQPKDSDDVWKTFLQKNLEVLRNCHERYSLDLDDSDEEDATNNFVYQPKNPYNERLLPHIYGSKLWNEHWHVGLCEDSNSYSGDDISEAFSETSSSPAEDNDSFASNSANLTEWASTTSITNEKNQQQQPIRIQNASSLRGSQPLFPPAQEILPNAASGVGSETSSAVSATVPIVLKQNEPRFDIFAPVQDSPPPPPLSSSSSSASSLQQQIKSVAPSKNNIRRDSADFVAKPETVSPNINSSSYVPSIKRRPVNLFDDDDFSSFLTEIVDKSTSREAAAVPQNNTATSRTAVKTDQKEHENKHPSIASNTQPISINSQMNKKPTTLNLFDSPDSSPKNEDTFNQIKEVIVTESREEKIVPSKLSSKTLFDDDDDDDFLSYFAAKKDNITKSVNKLKLFDDDIEDDLLQKVGQASAPTVDMIAKIPTSNEDKDLFKNTVSIKQKDLPSKTQNLFHEVTNETPNSEERKEEDDFIKIMQQPVNLFDDVTEPDDKNANKNSRPTVKTDIFSSEDDDDLFKTTFEQTAKKSSQILEEKVDVIKHVNAEPPKDYHQNPKENPVPIEDMPPLDFSLHEADMHQGASGDSSNDWPQKDTKDVQMKEEIVKPSDEIVHSNNEELIEEVPNALKQSAAPIEEQVKNTYSDIFLDEPPDDDTVFFQTLDSNALAAPSLTNTQYFEQDSYEPALPNLPTADRSVIPTSSYSNLGLFSDVPPDDDLEDLSVESANINSNEPKRIHSIFYDDFNETMEALNNRKSLETNPSLHSIFYDEPPPDDDFQTFIENTAKFSGTKSTSTDKIVDSIQSLATKQETDKADETTITPPKSITVSKLKIPNININVQALLPGAAQKSQLRKSIERDKEVETTSIPAKTNTSPNISPQTELKRDSAENILVNVCKNRVRAPAQRRPSTRRGRQENYRKSLVAEQADELNTEEENKPDIKADGKTTQREDEVLPKTTVESNKEISKDIRSSAHTSTELLKNIPTQSIVEDLFSETEQPQQEKNVKKLQATMLKSKSNVLFDDDDDGDDDYDFLFGDINKNKSIKESVKPAERDDFVRNDNLKANTITTQNNKSDARLEIPGFDDVGESENAAAGSKLFEASDTSATSTASTIKINTKRAVSISGGLFDDNDDGDDENADFLFDNKINSTRDIFGDSSSTKTQSLRVDIGENKKAENSTADIKIDSKPANNTKTHSKESEKNVSSVNIFGDDDDDDSLFGSSTSKKQPAAVANTTSYGVVSNYLTEQKLSDSNVSEEQQNKMVTQPKVSTLFGSDEDEQNDDKFLHALKNPAKLKTRLSKAAEKVDTKALFSDTDDDDEDLFGSKATKAAIPKSSQSNVNTTTKKSLLQNNKTKPNADITTDNPLADLFND